MSTRKRRLSQPLPPQQPSKPEYLVDSYNIVWGKHVLFGLLTAAQVESLRRLLPADWQVIHCTKASAYRFRHDKPSEVALAGQHHTLAQMLQAMQA